MPPASADERALADLEHRFEAASQSMALANRSAGATGMDTTSDVEAARAAVRRVDSKLQEKVKAFRESME